MVLTKKFSEFVEADLTNPDNELVGLSDGQNARSDKVTEWTTLTRPDPPFNGLMGYNTDSDLWEYYNESLAAWVQFSSSAGAVNITAGTGLLATPNPITNTGTIILNIPVLATWGGTGFTSYALGDTLYASSSTALSKLAGNITSTKMYLSQTGTGAVSAAPTWEAISGGDITGAALTRVDDTNVTLTLGGSPTTALLRATSLTLGWTGQLGLTRGGTNASLTASNGGIVWSNATQLQILSGTATANQVLLSGATATPAWSTATYPPITTINELLYSSANNTIAGLPTANSSILITNSSGVPAWSTTLPSGTGQPDYVAQGRLTLTSGVPITTTDVTAATTIYFTPFKGSFIDLYNGTTWDRLSFSQISIAVPSTTGTMYDVFIYNNSGTPTLELTAWTNVTTRATALTTQNGVYVKTGALTRRYLGSFLTTGVSGQTEDSATNRFLWNYYNRSLRWLRNTAEGTANWTYSSSTIRQANANTANQLNFIIGVSEDIVDAICMAFWQGNTTGTGGVVGIGLDATNVNNSQIVNYSTPGVANTDVTVTQAIYKNYIAVGYHFLAWVESNINNANTVTWFGNNGNVNLQSGIMGTMWA